jgi:hypothetical protein
MQNTDMVSGRGATKGELKSNFKRVIGSVEAFQRQPFFSELIKKCERQKIFTGEIAGIPFKGCVDFFDAATASSYDTKCMRDFKKIYSKSDTMHVNWYFAYGYNYQMAIYRELINHTCGKSGVHALLAVTKEEVPDVAAFMFSDEILDNAIEVIKEYAPVYDRIKRGGIEPEPCGSCDYCKQVKILKNIEMVVEYE